MRGAALLILMVAVIPALADTVYQRVRPDGSIEYSDQSLPGSIPKELPEVQTYEAQPLPPLAQPPAVKQAPAIPAYQALRITQPVDDQTVFFDAAGIGVTVMVRPNLRPGDRVVVYLDGQPVAAAPSTSLTIPTPERGTHRLTVEVQNAGGAPVLRAPPVTFHLRQHSLLNR